MALKFLNKGNASRLRDDTWNGKPSFDISEGVVDSLAWTSNTDRDLLVAYAIMPGRMLLSVVAKVTKVNTGDTAHTNPFTVGFIPDVTVATADAPDNLDTDNFQSTTGIAIGSLDGNGRALEVGVINDTDKIVGLCFAPQTGAVSVDYRWQVGVLIGRQD